MSKFSQKSVYQDQIPGFLTPKPGSSLLSLSGLLWLLSQLLCSQGSWLVLTALETCGMPRSQFPLAPSWPSPPPLLSVSCTAGLGPQWVGRARGQAAASSPAGSGGVAMERNTTLEILLHSLLQISALLFCLGPALRGSS